jgi:Arylsulfotransferase (ASST)
VIKRRILTALTPVAVMLGVALCSAGPAAAAPSFSITTTPSLYPSFNPNVTDYVARCSGAPVQVAVQVPLGTDVSVDGGLGHMTAFTTTVGVTTGQSFSVTEIGLTNSSLHTYFVRCLPADFPNFTSQKVGTPQAAFYLVKPSGFSPTAMPYIALFDTDGVPVWWLQDHPGFDAGILRNNTITSIVNGGFHPQLEVHNLNGSLALGLDAVNTGGSSTPFFATDGHDVQLLPNGDYLFGAIDTIQGDLTFMGGPANATISNQVIEEVNPAGQLVWSWDVAQHIPFTCADPSFYASDLGPNFLAPGDDIYHWNSLEEVGNNLLLSFRNCDAVFLINKQTGNVIWKLGGTPTPESLRIVGDPVFAGGSGFGGQHFARFYGGTTTMVTVHDNGTLRNRGPRAVLYKISLSQRTATMVEQVSDPAAPPSFCCGSATKLSTGDWVASWGSTPIVEEINPAGQRQFYLHWDDPGTFAYRAEPVMPGQLTVQQLRTAMNQQYPR